MNISNAGRIRDAALYFELVGGLGDALLRLYFSGKLWYEALSRLDEERYAVVTLMCHNPYLGELFLWHPNRHRIHVVDLGFTTPFHPWENRDWRTGHGLPEEAPCPPYAKSDTLDFYSSKADDEIIENAKSGGPYIVLAATAGGTGKSIPEHVKNSIVTETVRLGFKCVVVGRGMYLRREGRSQDVESGPGVIDTVDRLSVPGMANLVKSAAGVVSADTSVLHVAWSERRPVFLLYNRRTLETMIPGGACGYMHGIDQSGTDHMEFAAYSSERYQKWLKSR